MNERKGNQSNYDDNVACSIACRPMTLQSFLFMSNLHYASSQCLHVDCWLMSNDWPPVDVITIVLILMKLICTYNASKASLICIIKESESVIFIN